MYQKRNRPKNISNKNEKRAHALKQNILKHVAFVTIMQKHTLHQPSTQKLLFLHINHRKPIEADVFETRPIAWAMAGP